jgi:hypothetical protein
MKRWSLWLCVLTLVGCASDMSSDGEQLGNRTSPAPSTATPSTASGTADGETHGTGSATTGSRSSAAPGSDVPAPTMGLSAPAAPSGASTTPSAATPPPGGVPASMAASGASKDAAAAPSLPTATTSTGANPNNIPVEPGVLTAGTWDDNKNFDRFTKFRHDLQGQQLAGVLPSTDDEHTKAHDEFSQEQAARQTLDVSLVIDTTGSMGDEIQYLQSEFTSLSSAIESKYPNAQQRWSLVVYRDTTDDYVTRWYDFRDDAADFRDKLGMQAAAGGGDFPEAPDAAIAAMNQLAWRSDASTARLAFWVADAPHHNDKAQAMLDAIRGAHEIGVHLYPVASSGVDELTELTMRTAAQLTGGRYVFLTDDSGVGNSHKEPSIPCYFVTHLDKAILRMVDIELTGTYEEPNTDDVIRTSGDPKDGTCALESGENVAVF